MRIGRVEKSIALLIVSVCCCPGILAIAPAALAQSSGAVPTPSPSPLSPLEQAQANTDNAARAADAAYKKYAAIKCTGTPKEIEDAKKELGISNLSLNQATEREISQYADAIEAESAENSASNQFDRLFDNPNSGFTEVRAARKNLEQARKNNRGVRTNRSTKIKNRLAGLGYVFGDPEPECKPANFAPGPPNPKPTPEKKPGLLDSILGHVAIGVGGSHGDRHHGDRTDKTPATNKPPAQAPATPSPQD